jgi:acetyl-CoA synthetase
LAKKKTKKKSKKTKKKKKSSKVKVTRKKTRKVKKTKKVRKGKSKKVKKRRKSNRVKKVRKINFKSPKLIEDSDGKSIIKVSDSWDKHAYVNKSKYQKKYKLSIKDNEKFWAKEGKRISWIKKYSKIKDVKYSKEDVRIKWFYDGTLNASVNCVDRHLKKNVRVKLQLFG